MLAITPEATADAAAIERLLDLSFGADRRKKVSYRFRHGLEPIHALSFVARLNGELVGAIRYWPLRLNDEVGLLLGPLAIDPARRGQGIGRALIHHSLATAERLRYRLVFLVGDPAYYAQHGFAVVPSSIRMQDEDPGRVQYTTLGNATLPQAGGDLCRVDGRPLVRSRNPGPPVEEEELAAKDTGLRQDGSEATARGVDTFLVSAFPRGALVAGQVASA
jgi:predicted N-acetyltransferase YhbS